MTQSWEYKDFEKWIIENECDEKISENAYSLEFSNINLNKLFICKYKFTNLTILWIENNNLKVFPIEICELINLKCLLIFNNKIKKIPKEIEKLKNLEILKCHENKINYLPNTIGKLINLKRLTLYKNKLKYLPKSIVKLVNLEKLNCSENKLKKLPYNIGKLANLIILDCIYNDLKTLPKSLKKIKNLNRLYCGGNSLYNLFENNTIFKLKNLRDLEISINYIFKIPIKISMLINLQDFECSYCKLDELPKEMGLLMQLKTLLCYNNMLKTIPIEIGQLPYLEHIECYDNPIEYLPAPVLRILNGSRKIQNIYNDNQNVHNHNIQKCIKKSINYILSVPPSITNIHEEIIYNDFLTKQTKELLFEYISQNEIHQELNISFEDLFLNIFSIILNHPDKKEILNILNIEMQDAHCKCFTGRISRLVNVLNGFDENIKIEISENEQIGNIIIRIKNNLNPYDINLHKKIVKEELLNLKYDENIIDEWLIYITD